MDEYDRDLLHNVEMYAYSIEAEIRRRDKWLIRSIWGAVDQVFTLTRTIVIAAVWWLNGWGAWWQISLAVIAWAAWAGYDHLRIERLMKDDMDKIERDSVLDPP
jgi:hypothetical protein